MFHPQSPLPPSVDDRSNCRNVAEAKNIVHAMIKELYLYVFTPLCMYIFLFRVGVRTDFPLNINKTLYYKS